MARRRAACERALALSLACAFHSAGFFQETGCRICHTESWNPLFAPKGTPQVVIDRVAQIAADMAKDAGVQKQMATFGSVAVANAPEEFAQMLRDETALWANLVKEIGRK
jgi:tripartite-type tricarboxylate transporter receptor subunit TctC